MAAKSKLELILELKNKIFNNKLMQTKKKFTNSYDKMRGKIKQLKVEHSQAFRSMINEVPGASRVVDLLTNKYIIISMDVLTI